MSFLLGQFRDGIILIIIVAVNAMIGFYEEWKSENILAFLKNLVVNKCNVIRNGKMIEILAENLVPGDIVRLNEGDGIPADIRLTESNGFSANEVILTGESLPSDKDHLFSTDKTLTFPERKNCVYMGTTVARGQATGIVYATGIQTEIGKISTSSENIKSADAPVQVEIKDVAKKLTYATLVIAIILFVVRLVMHDSVALALVMKAGYNLDAVEKEYPLVKLFAFDSFRKRATIIRTHKHGVISFVKGSIESVLEASTKTISGGKVSKLTSGQKKEILSLSATFSEKALRVIAIAYKDIETKKEYTVDDAEKDLTFAGFVTMLAPPHKEVKAAVRFPVFC